MNDEDRKAIAESVTFSGPDESVAVGVLIANLGWEEDRAPGRDAMTGAWRLCFRDSLDEPDWRIDLPRQSRAAAQEEARHLVAARLGGDTDLRVGHPHVSFWD